MDENNKGSGGKLDGFFNGKGFYIVLFLCAGGDRRFGLEPAERE